MQNRLLRLLGLARWPMRYLMLHPGVIDELADERLLHDRFDPEAYKRELEERHQGWERSSQAEEELLLDTLRRAHHAEVFRTLVRDVEGHITVEQVADDLSALADATLCCAIRWAWKHLKTAHRPEAQLAVIAYGKLGGKELGYGSDLDVVFVYDDAETEPDKAAEVYGAFVRKLITWLTMRTAAGELFDIDTALRPNGNSGPARHVDDVVRELPDRPRQQHGVDLGAPGADARALVRRHRAAGAALRGGAPRRPRRAARPAGAARRSAGDAREGARGASGQGRPLRRQAQPGRHDGRRVRGAGARPRPRRRARPSCSTTSATSRCCVAPRRPGCLPAGVGAAAADAYRDLRRAQHRARLDEQPTQVEPELLAEQSSAVLALWRAVFA